MKGLILAGGTGTRLRPLTYTANKHLIPIANKPILFYGIEALRDAGIKDIGIVLGTNDPEAVKIAVEDGSKFGIRVTYIFQGEPKGIAHAVYCAKDFIREDDFLLYLGDNMLKRGVKNLVEDFEKTKPDASIYLCKVKNPEMFGLVELDESGKIRKLVEKPKHPKSDLALIGVYLFKPSIFKVIKTLKPSGRGELEITEAIDNLVKSKKNVKYRIVTGWWKDTGKPEDILEANRLVLDDIKPTNKGKIDEEVNMHGRVFIDKGTVIKEGSTIKGPVTIGKNCEIGPNTYIGPYTSIGNNTTIRNSEIEDSIILGDSNINCKKKIVGSLIGRHSIIKSYDKLPHGNRFIIGENTTLEI
ncbi:MAG: glucose-1-phosphate thymidylyltransferase [Candidatus Aenigmatarchaeota archaeon]|nr:MAG: glucose-1-phosphate thymidylyltransferase [Candidatus Aenigmarchaeota archaeon]